MRKVYLAGPEGFLPNGVEIGRRKKLLCERYGFVGLFPFDNEPAVGAGRVDWQIYAANVAMMCEADVGIFNLTPFRGPSADVGTVFELGLMAGLGKRLFGYTGSTAPLCARVAGAAPDASGQWRDGDGYTVEDFGNADNLMIDACLALHGNSFIRVEAGGRIDDLGGFELCLRAAG